MICVLLLAAGEAWESPALADLEAHPETVVLKRCVDVDDLLAAVTSGQADVAVVSLDAPGLDAASVAHLRRHGVRPVAVAASRSDDLDVCCDFLAHVRGGYPASTEERGLFAEAVEASRVERAARLDELGAMLPGLGDSGDLALPLPDASVDAVVMSFGLRNTVDPDAALTEFARVTRPGGTLVICEFSRPPSRSFDGLYRFYNDRVLPVVAKAVSSNADAYDYLNESIRDWPDQRRLSAWIREAGWADVAYRNLSLGIVALHRATKPRAGSRAK